MQRFELLILDCDGVLVDSERITNRVFAQMLKQLGVSVTLEDMFEHFVGREMSQCLDLVAELSGRPVPDEFESNYRVRTRAALLSELTAVPGIEAALDVIELPYCVASNGSQEKMRMTLGITGLLSRFEGKLVSATEVLRGKPAPDVFLHAAKKYGASPSACAVVEDTPTGVTAAVAAGMTVFGYAAPTPSARLLAAGACQTFSHMSELPKLISKPGNVTTKMTMR